MPEKPLDAEAEVRRRIAQRGRITVAEFMEVALYWPHGGYYTRQGRIGPAGDYYTAPTAHPLFGALLCLQLFQCWRVLHTPRPFWVVELGAGGGVLARDVAAYSVHLPGEFSRALRYVCVDRVPGHGVERYARHPTLHPVERVAAASMPMRNMVGCVVSNELLDAFPVHVVRMVQGRLLEVYVTLHGARLEETLDEPSTPALARRFQELDITLEEGQQAEVDLGLEAWMGDVARSLERGFVFTIDYGDTAPRRYSPQRRHGTLTAYYRHTQVANVYQRVGKQDITALVDFTTLGQVGLHFQFHPIGLTTQRDFLRRLGLFTFVQRLREADLPRREHEANRLGALELQRQNGMGDFKVFVQGRGVGTPRLWGLVEEHDGYLDELTAQLPVPLLRPEHTPLLAGATERPGLLGL